MNKQFLCALEADLPCETRPFARLAEKFCLKEEELLAALHEGMTDGLIRRYGARIRHQKAGFVSNVMVAWEVPTAKVGETASVMTKHYAVSHCYERSVFPGFPFNLYTMIHGRSVEACEKAIADISEVSGISQYRALWTEKEFKKTTPAYSQLLSAEVEER